ncbi:non-ribosomal peptide synthetase [Flavivirga jejuensis]|uniref:Amino acid adenylation domain-containing protein n=1 Tax=Flavivirga jejuensis TaxID=870487 RepID=A0ABT8WVP5_9FLAO|nr:non-ribosomal peptide synthetase [Flavivirga jejuensis]MDO5977248.1 amino acid adenylation domain-containing protein [Flavivirga jejuensis]
MTPKELLLDYKKGKLSTEQFKKEFFGKYEKEANWNPLSEAQKGIWAHQKTYPNSSVYNIPIAFRLYQKVNILLFKKACTFLLEQYPWINNTFSQNNVEPSQIMRHELSLDFNYEEISYKKKKDLIEDLRNRSRRPFNLTKDSLMRVDFLSESRKKQYVLITIHHIVFDGSSIQPFIEILLETYAKLIIGEKPILSPLKSTYNDFVKWEKKILSNKEIIHKYKSYWLNHLLPTSPIWKIPFPTSILDSNHKNHSHKQLSFLVNQKNQIRQFCQNHGLNLSNLFLCVFKILLYKYTGQQDFSIGMPVTIRPDDHFENIPGLFINMLMIRGEKIEKQSFIEFAKDLQRTTAEGLDNSFFPYSKLRKALYQSQGSDQSDLFNVAYAYQNFSQNGGLRSIEDRFKDSFPISFIEEVRQENIYAIELEVLEANEAFKLNFKYKQELFTNHTISRMTIHYKKLLKEILENPQLKLFEYNILSEKEKEKVLYDWNSTLSLDSNEECVHEVFENFVDQTPERPVIIYSHKEISYQELDEQANLLSNYLKKFNIGKEKLVGVYLERSPETIISFLAILKAGAAYLPLDYLYPKERIALILDDSDASFIITHSTLEKNLPNHNARLILIDKDKKKIQSQRKSRPSIKVSQSDLAYVIYTSGSTGTPKGVMLEHKGIPNLARAQVDAFKIDRDSCILPIASFSFDASIWEIIMVLCSGAKMVLDDSKEMIAGEKLYKLIEENAISHLTLPPSLLATLPKRKLPSLITLIVAGEACTENLIREWADGRVFLNAYGPTEYTVCASISEPLNKNQRPDIGRPIRNTRLYVLDNNMHPVPVGIPGELYIAGIGLARGYLNKKELTNKLFVKDPFVLQKNEKMYKTGDLVRFNKNGKLEFLGRIDNQVKVRGVRLELGEIENCLDSHQLIKTNAVVLQESSGNKQLIAYYVLKHSKKPIDSLSFQIELKDYLRKILPKYMIPHLFIRLDGLPLNPNGKIDKKKLENDLLLSKKREKSIKPLSQLEEKVFDLWKETLKIKEVGLQEGFFEVGGDSISAVIVADKISHWTGANFSVTDLFKYNNIKNISQYLSTLKVSSEFLPAKKKQIERSEKTDNSIEKKQSSRKATLDDQPEYYKDSIAIIGISCQVPGAKDKSQFWENLCKGQESIKFHSAEELSDFGLDDSFLLHPDLIPVSSTISDKKSFDADFFSISPKEAELMDPQLRHLLMHSWSAIEDAGYNVENIPNTGVFMSASNNMYQALSSENLLDECKIVKNSDEYVSILQSQGGTIPTMISYKLGLKGPSFFIHSNCSSSLAGLYAAFQCLQNGEAEYTLVGGSTLFSSSLVGYLHQPGLNFSSDGHLKAFDAAADGMVPGEGVAVIMMKKTENAIKDGDNIYGIIRGVGINNDGADKAGFYAPSVNGQIDVIQKVLNKTNINPDSICYVESHGTGTKLGDPIEVAALTDVYTRYTTTKQYCGIGSVKPNIGHLDTAAGLAGCIKLVLSLHYKKIPPSINFKKPNPDIKLKESPFYVVDKIKNLEDNQLPKRMALSGFGLGGTNVHAIFENYIPKNLEKTEKDEKENKNSTYVIPLSAKNKERLKIYAKEILKTISLSQCLDKNIYDHRQMMDKLVSTVSEIKSIDRDTITQEQYISELDIDTYQFTKLIHRLANEWGIELEPSNINQSMTLKEFVLYASSIYEECSVKKTACKEINLQQLAYTLQLGRKVMENRVLFLVKDISDLSEKLEKFITGKQLIEKCFQGASKNASSYKRFKSIDEDTQRRIKKWGAKGKVKKLAHLWAQGFPIDWNILYKSKKPLRLSLPTYPFENSQYWLENSSSSSYKLNDSISEIKNEINIMTFEEVWAENPNTSINYQDLDKIVCFFHEHYPKDDFSSNWKEQTGGKVIYVSLGNRYLESDSENYCINYSDKHSYEKLFRRIKKHHGSINGIIYGWGLGKTMGYEADQTAILLVLQGITNSNLSIKKVLLLAQLSGEINDTYKNSWTGFEKSAGFVIKKHSTSILFEHENLNTIDQIKHIAAELLSEESNVLYKNNTRYITKLIPVSITKGQSVLRKGGNYIITGGMGGLGFIFADYLSKHYQSNLILIGRSNLDKTKRKKIKHLKKAGGNAIYIQCDICDKERLSFELDQARIHFGKINGLIHSAGIPSADNVIEKNVEQFNKEARPKVLGTIVLDNLLENEPLDFMCFFSSSSAILGDFGACSYSLANRFEMSYAAYRNKLVKSGKRKGKTSVINWPAWRNGGMGKNMQEQINRYLQASGQLFLETNTGIKIFEQILSSDKEQILVMNGDKSRINRMLGIENQENMFGEQEDNLIKKLKKKTTLKKRNIKEDVEEDLKILTQTILKIPTKKINMEENLVDFGYDSISMTKLASELSKHYKTKITPSIFFSYSSLKKVRDYLLNQHKELIDAFYQTIDITPFSIESEKKKQLNLIQPLKDAQSEDTPVESIAIIGMSGKFPKSENIAEMWDKLLKGENAVEKISCTTSNWRLKSKQEIPINEDIEMLSCGCIPGISEFDPLFFEISPLEAEGMDPRQRLLLQESWKALEDAGYGPEQIKVEKIGVFVGVEQGDYQLLKNEEPLITSNHDGILASRLAYFLNLNGPVLAINTACSSSLVAIHQACLSLKNKECSTAIAAGVNLIFTTKSYKGMKDSGMLSPTGKCAAFDQKADGIVPGEAVAAIVLKPLSNALKDNDPIYATIKGSGINYDGKTNGITAPGGTAQVNLLTEIYNKHKINPEEIEYIVTHGTGTKLGDPVEVNALNDVFKKYTTKKNLCALTSSKTNFGHTLAASGIVNLITLVQSMRHEIIPSSLHYEQENEFINWESSPFYVNKVNKPWKKKESKPLLGAISSFGMSGTNAHMVIESFKRPLIENPVKALENLMIVLSAKTRNSLEVKIKDLINEFEAVPYNTEEMVDVCYTLQTGRHHFAYRFATLVSSRKQAIKLLKLELSGEKHPVLYRNKVKQGFKEKIKEKKKLDKLLQEISNCINNTKRYSQIVDSIAKFYCDGYDVLWNRLYDLKIPNRISLPTYPFSKETYWVSNQATNTHDMPHNKKSLIHPLLHKKTIGITNAHFTSFFKRNEFPEYTKSLNGSEHLIGTVYLEMIREAIHQISKADIQHNSNNKKITNISWGKPIVWKQSNIQIHLALFDQENGIMGFEFYNNQDEDNPQPNIYCQGYVQYINSRSQPILNLDNLQIDCDQSVLSFNKKQQTLELTYKKSVSNYHIYSGINRVLIKISEEDVAHNGFKDIILCPSLLDTICQVFAALLNKNTHKTEIAFSKIYPCTLKELEVFSEETSPTWVFINYRELNLPNKVQSLDIDFCNDQGIVLYRMKKFTVRLI